MAVVPLKIGMLTRIIVGVEEDIELNLEPVLYLFRVGIEGDIGRDHAEYRGDAVAAVRLIGFGRARDHHVAAIEANLFFGLAQRRVARVAVARIDLAAGKSDLSRVRAEERRVGKGCVSTGRSRWAP